jgi:hypothetical protein
MAPHPFLAPEITGIATSFCEYSESTLLSALVISAIVVKPVSLVYRIFHWSKNLELVEPACVDHEYVSGCFTARSSSPSV